MSTNLSEFKEYELYPALWSRIDTIFPEMGFKMVGGYWRSSKHLGGSPSQDNDKTFVHFRRKDLIKENGGEALSLIDYEMRRTGKDFIEALRSLAEQCGLSLPNSDTEEYKAYEEKRQNRERANDTFRKALWSGTPEASAVLDYLRSVRQWSDDEIRKAELGYIDTSIKASLSDGTEFSDPNVGSSHRLVIPYRNGSRLLGFKFRDIHCKEGLKYRNSKGLSKSTGLFGIGIGVKDVTIVEGELDALHAQVKGANNVVATTGNAASEEQIRDAIKRGVKRFTLLYDNDEAGKKFIASTIATVEHLRAEAYVAFLPEGTKDTDEYLTSHSIEEWKAETDKALPSYVWKYNQVVEGFCELCNRQGGAITMKQREDYFSEVEKILNEPSMKPHNREVVYSIMKQTEEETLFKVDDFRAWADRAYLRQQAKNRTAEAEQASTRIQELLKEGKTDEALKVMKETVSHQGEKTRGAKFAKVFAPSTPSEIASSLSAIEEGIPTGYRFKEGKHDEPFTLNAGLTFICGYRGHGKTSFLNNIALNDARRNIQLQNGKSVLYFSYEVEKRRLIADMLNTFVNDPGISFNPLETILSYFKGKDFFRKKDERGNPSDFHKRNFEAKKDIFFRDYLSNGALTIVDENYKVGELLEAIKYYISTRPVSIVCIDYAQLIYSEDYSRQRTEEIKRVVNDIKDYANKAGIPFVLAAQFNRDVDSPVSVDTKNIGEGGDFERIADTCIGLFNLKELHPLPKNKSEEEAAKKLLKRLFPDRPTGTDLEPIQGKLFVRLLKRRYGYYPIDTVLEWTGSTKYIEPNDSEREEPQTNNGGGSTTDSVRSKYLPSGSYEDSQKDDNLPF